MTNCWFCGHEMVWSADFNADEVGTGGPEQVAAELSCPNCGATATFTSTAEESEGTATKVVRATPQKWNSVDKKLPDPGDIVLAMEADGSLVMARYQYSDDGSGLIWCNEGGELCSEVTHWIELPEPPKTEDQEADSDI